MENNFKTEIDFEKSARMFESEMDIRCPCLGEALYKKQCLKCRTDIIRHAMLFARASVLEKTAQIAELKIPEAIGEIHFTLEVPYLPDPHQYAFQAELDEELEIIERICDVFIENKRIASTDAARTYVEGLLGVAKACRTHLMHRVQTYSDWSRLAEAIWPEASVSVPSRFIESAPHEDAPMSVSDRKVQIARKVRSVLTKIK